MGFALLVLVLGPGPVLCAAPALSWAEWWGPEMYSYATLLATEVDPGVATLLVGVLALLGVVVNAVVGLLNAKQTRQVNKAVNRSEGPKIKDNVTWLVGAAIEASAERANLLHRIEEHEKREFQEKYLNADEIRAVIQEELLTWMESRQGS